MQASTKSGKTSKESPIFLVHPADAGTAKIASSPHSPNLHTPPRGGSGGGEEGGHNPRVAAVGGGLIYQTQWYITSATMILDGER